MLKEIAKIHALPLGSITPTTPYCVNALEKEIAYLRDFDEDRVLYHFRDNAGLDTRGAKPFGGWESLLIAGHAMGHYFTALAQASVNKGVSDADRKTLKDKLDLIISELSKAQLSDGFLWGGQVINRDDVEFQFKNVEQGKFDLFKEAWVPWYTMHKILEGLVAAYEIAGSEQALDIAKKLGEWVYNRTQSWSENTHRTVLNCEYGGMNDIMYELYRCTDDERFAVAAHAFDEEPLFDKILENAHNVLSGRHANTTIPKIIGALRRYQLCDGKEIGGEKVDGERYLNVAKTFWQNVMEHHTYHTGGNSEWEHFRGDDTLDKERTNCNCETCNVYNMLKLTRELFKITGEKKYAQYLENAFLNHILASQNPETGMTTYFQSMATGYFKVFSSRWEDFWCCTGSGMENFTKLGDSLIFDDNGAAAVCAYLSCTADFKGLKITVESDIPASDKAIIALSGDGKTDLKLRVPEWAAGEMTVTKNGEATACENVGGFMVLTDAKGGDSVEVTIPRRLEAVSLCDCDNAVALKYGPLLLAAKLGNEDMITTRTGVAVAIPEKSVSDGILHADFTAEELKAEPEKYAKKVGGLEFELCGLRFVPYYLIRERYGIYWHIEK